MNPALMIATVCWSIGVLMFGFFTVRYGLETEFMPYHAAAIGSDWVAPSEGTRLVISGLIRIVAGAFAAGALVFGLTLLPMRRGERWAIYAAAAAGYALVLPAIHTSWRLVQDASAPAPLVPSIVGLVLLTIGVACAFVAARHRARPASVHVAV